MNALFCSPRCAAGKAQVAPARIVHLQKMLSPKDRAQLLRDLPLAPAWDAPAPALHRGGRHACAEGPARMRKWPG